MKRKVLIIVENAPVPFDARVWKEALSLSQNGYEVTVLCPQDKGYERRHEVIHGIHIYRHPMPREGNSPLGYLLEYTCALFCQFLYSWWIYFLRGFDIIQGCNPPDDIFLVALPFKLLGVKYIFDHHDANPELYLAKFNRENALYRILVLLEKLTYRFSDSVICTNSSYRDLAIKRGGIDPEDAFIVRNGPDLKNFTAVPHDQGLKYGKPFLVGYVGNMSKQDGLDILVDVAVHIKSLGRHDIHFTCVGGGTELRTLRQMIVDKGVEDIFNFTGRVPDEQLMRILSTADVCVNPDKPCVMNDISTMIKIMEYMALGKPIVQFDLKEGRLSAHQASLYAEKEGGATDFAEKVLWLIDNPDKRKWMGDLGRERVKRELAWEYSVENLLAAYQNCFDKSERSRRRRVDTSDSTSDANAMPRVGGGTAEFASDQRVLGEFLTEHFRCPADIGNFVVPRNMSISSGFFRFGSETICYGHCSSAAPSKEVIEPLHDAGKHLAIDDGSLVRLPFDPMEVVDNLRRERYPAPSRGLSTIFAARIFQSLYYVVRPALSVSTRKYIQRFYFQDWDKISFPRWPVDRTVEEIFEQILRISMTSRKIESVPFIWFWPEGAQSCAMMTHDVETAAGYHSCEQLMDLDDSFGIKSSFQIVPEQRYKSSPSALENIRKRGFEINVHDLNHDGRLTCNRKEFLSRAERINMYGKQFGALGFRSAVMYRNADWYEALDFSYDMSIPNVAHLEPQRGGCCTVLPFFIGKILELPLTTTQDYSLFNILEDHSIRLWKEQISLIREKHGLISFIIHPDYSVDPVARRVYADLLQYLSELRSQGETWIALPGEVAAWWRLRSKMKLIKVGASWRIEGEGKERARIAYAVMVDDKLTYTFAGL